MCLTSELPLERVARRFSSRLLFQEGTRSMARSSRPMGITVITVMLALVLVGGSTCSADFEYQSMAWVLGADSTSIRSPLGAPQSTGMTWSIVAGNVEARYHPDGNVITDRLTQDITDLNAVGLDSFEDYRDALESVVDAWADISGFQNLGYIAETGDVMVGGTYEIGDRGAAAGVGHLRFMAYDSPIIPTNILASATYIPEPGVGTDNTYNRSRAGDVRFRSDSSIWAQGGDDGFYFRKIAMHEVGHVLGFGHNSVSDSVMGQGLYTETGLGVGDIEGATTVYGLVPEPTTILLLATGGFCLLAYRRRSWVTVSGNRHR